MTRMNLGGVALVSALAALGSVCAAAPLAAPGTPLPDPKAPIVELAHIFRHAKGLSYSSTLTYSYHVMTNESLNTGKPKVTIKRLDVTGELSKPDMFVYRLSGGGMIASDGVSTIAEDSPPAHYSRFPASHGFALGTNWDFVSKRVMKGNSPLLNYSMVGFIFGHITDRDFLHPESMTITGTSTTFAGAPVQDVEYKSASTDAHLYFDPTSGNLIGADTTYALDSGQSFEVRESITKLTLFRGVLPVADFATTPPPGAVLVPIPTKTAKPKTRTPSPRQPHQKKWRKVGGIWVYN